MNAKIGTFVIERTINRIAVDVRNKVRAGEIPASRAFEEFERRVLELFPHEYHKEITEILRQPRISYRYAG